MLRILVIGAVNSTARILENLVSYGFDLVGVIGHEPKNKGMVSGWADLRSLAQDFNIDYQGYDKINDPELIAWAASKSPDIIFAVGFSQLISDDWLDLPRLGCIGFHPTFLPKGRGRAPLAWITLEKSSGSATFFLMGKGADEGPIFAQSVFTLQDEDDAASVEQKILEHIDIALAEWLPRLKEGVWDPIPQDEMMATFYGVRKPEDGWVDWHNDAYFIDRLIKASSRPHPGAYTYFKDRKIIVWRSVLETELAIKGVIGRVLLTDPEKGFLVQCGNGLLWIRELLCENGELPPIRIGDKFGYGIEDEIYNLKQKIKENE